MTKPKLTKSVVDSLQPRATDYVTWCGQLRGFGCRVRPTGTKTFIAQYDFGGRKGVTRKVTIGAYGKLTAEQARDEAKRILAGAELGQDEASARAAKRAQISVTELCDEYLREGCEGKKPSTIATDKGRIERHIKPLLGRKRIGEIEKADFQRFLTDVAKGRTATDVKTKKHGRAIVTGGKGTATRTVRLLGGIFTYAVDRGYLKANPRAGVKLYPDEKGERFLNGVELGRLGDTLREAETTGLPWVFRDGAKAKHRASAENARDVISPYAVAAIRLLILTGCRAGEILNLKWAHVDFERGLLQLPDSKTGAKPVLLPAPALAILSTLPRIEGNPYVIAGEAKDKPRSDLKRPWSRISAHAGLADLRLHDLRHTFASSAAMAGFGLPIVGKLLGHASPTTTARYAHFADDPLRRASDSIGSAIAAALAGPADNVVPIKAAV